MLNKVVTFLMFGLVFGCSPSNHKIMSSVVKLTGERGSCSGTQVKAPSGKKYILTAGHCSVLADRGIIEVHTEDAGNYFSKVLEESNDSDLLLLEPAPGISGIKIANDLSRFETLRSFTRGAGLPTYETSGNMIAERIVQFEMNPIGSDEERTTCHKAKNAIESVNLFDMIVYEVCTVRVVETIMSTPIAPGSSGGLIANKWGELAGVASAGGGGYYYAVTLKDIQRFLSLR